MARVTVDDEKNPLARALSTRRPYPLGFTPVKVNQMTEDLQGRAVRWVVETLGENGVSPLEDKVERCLRFIEEAIELGQVVGNTREQVHRLVDYVFDRKVGELFQEIGGAMFTLYVVAASHGIGAEMALLTELERAEKPEVRERARRRQGEKREALTEKDAGVAVLLEGSLDPQRSPIAVLLGEWKKDFPDAPWVKQLDAALQFQGTRWARLARVARDYEKDCSVAGDYGFAERYRRRRIVLLECVRDLMGVKLGEPE